MSLSVLLPLCKVGRLSFVWEQGVAVERQRYRKVWLTLKMPLPIPCFKQLKPVFVAAIVPSIICRPQQVPRLDLSAAASVCVSSWLCLVERGRLLVDDNHGITLWARITARWRAAATVVWQADRNDRGVLGHTVVSRMVLQTLQTAATAQTPAPAHMKRQTLVRGVPTSVARVFTARSSGLPMARAAAKIDLSVISGLRERATGCGSPHHAKSADGAHLPHNRRPPRLVTLPYQRPSIIPFIQRYRFTLSSAGNSSVSGSSPRSILPADPTSFK
jgi:hypothetical protein